MDNAKVNKLQYLVTKHLLKFGKLEIELPDGLKLEVGTLQEDQNGNYVKTDDYCYVIATKGCNAATIDSYTLSLQFDDSENFSVSEDTYIDKNGNILKCLEVI